MNKLLLKLPLGALLFVFATSCEKKSDPEPSPQPAPAETPQDPATYLPTKNWTLQAVVQRVNNVNSDNFATYPPCSKDNIYKFQTLNATSGLGTYLEDDGAIVCVGTPSSNIAAQGSWKLNTAKDTISIRINPNSTFLHYRIIRSTDKTLEIVYLGNINLDPATFTYTYKVQ